MLRYLTLVAFFTTLAAAATAADTPKPTTTELQAKLDQANAQIANLRTVITLVQQQRDDAQKRAADNSIEAYMAQHPTPPKDDPKK